MCNPGKIAAFLIGATIAIAAAVVFYAIVAIQGGSWWTSGGNYGWMIAAGVALGVAIALISLALTEAVKCNRPPCKTQGDALIAGLTALIATLTALVVAGILAAFPSIIPGAGTAIGIAFGVIAVAAGVALIVVTGVLLPALDTCLGTASTAVQVARVLGFFVGIMLVYVGTSALGLPGLPFPFPPNPPVG